MTGSSTSSKAQAFKTSNLKERVYKYLDKFPESNIYTLYFEFPKAKKETLKVYKYRYHKEIRMTRNDLKELIKHLEKISFVMKYKVKILHSLNLEEKQAIIYMENFILKNGGKIE